MENFPEAPPNDLHNIGIGNGLSFKKGVNLTKLDKTYCKTCFQTIRSYETHTFLMKRDREYYFFLKMYDLKTIFTKSFINF